MRDLAVDDDTVYVVTSAAVMSIRAVPVAGGEVTVPLPASPRVDLLTVDADYLFFVGNFGVYRLRKRGP